MFQYAFYRANSKKIKNLCCDTSYFLKTEMHNGFELERIFNLNIQKNNNIILEKIIGSKTFFYKIIRKILKKMNFIFSTPEVYYMKNILNKKYLLFIGYWQSEKYFLNIQDIIRQDFKFTNFENSKNIELKNTIEETNSISVHIRRGDYLGNPFLDGLASLEYYKKSIDYILKKVKNPKFIIFSDDIVWCKSNLVLDKDSIFVDWNIGRESFRDMQLMSLCRHNIIANSSFSWWGAWLNANPKKIVLAPKRWFTKESNLDYGDIVPETWIKIENEKFY